MSAARRSSLLRMALTALGPCALPACTGVLLALALNSYSPEPESDSGSGGGGSGGGGGSMSMSSSSALTTTNESTTTTLSLHEMGQSQSQGQGQGQGGLILLSRSSQRKASRALKSSQPEELFRLAMDCVLTRSAEVCTVRAFLAITSLQYFSLKI